jgi:hypothetical protein
MSPRSTKAKLLVCALAAMAAAGCGETTSSDSKKASKSALQEWVTAAAAGDGAKYCEMLTKNLLETITAAKGDQATTKCETRVKQSSPKLPLLVSVKSGKATKTTAEATLTAKAPAGPVSLRKVGGEFKIDKVATSPAAPKPAKPKPQKKKPKPQKKKPKPTK